MMNRWKPCITILCRHFFWPLFFEVGAFAMPCVLFINLIRLHTTGAYCCYFSFKSYFMIRISEWKKRQSKYLRSLDDLGRGIS